MSEDFEKDFNEDLLEESESYPVMPLRNTVLFPQQVIPIYIGRDKSLKLINELPSSSKHIVVVAQEDGSIENPEPDEMYSFGTLAVVLKVFDMPDNSKSAIVQGIDRVKILDFKEKDPYYRAVVQRISDNAPSDDVEIDALANNLRQVFNELIKVAPNLSEEHTGMLSNIQKPASRFLISGVRDSKKPLKFTKGLVLNNKDGKNTKRIDNILRFGKSL